MTRRSTIFSLVCLELMLAVLSPSFAATGQTVVAEIQKRYVNTNDFEANFVQEFVGRVMKQPQRGEGRVFFKKKGLMRWDYRLPKQQFISNGQVVWYYQEEEKQVFIYELSRLVREKTPLAFLAGEGDLGRDFKLVSLKDGGPSKEDIYLLELVPVEPHAGLSKLILTVDRKSYYVRQADVIDAVGNITRTRFTDMRTNVGLPNSLFSFTIPPGVEVIRVQNTGEMSSADKKPASK